MLLKVKSKKLLITKRCYKHYTHLLNLNRKLKLLALGVTTCQFKLLYNVCIYITGTLKAFVNELGIKPRCSGKENKISVETFIK